MRGHIITIYLDTEEYSQCNLVTAKTHRERGPFWGKKIIGNSLVFTTYLIISLTDRASCNNIL